MYYLTLLLVRTGNWITGAGGMVKLAYRMAINSPIGALVALAAQSRPGEYAFRLNFWCFSCLPCLLATKLPIKRQACVTVTCWCRSAAVEPGSKPAGSSRGWLGVCAVALLSLDAILFWLPRLGFLQNCLVAENKVVLLPSVGLPGA